MNRIFAIINLVFLNAKAQDWKWTIHAGSSLSDGCIIKCDQNNDIYLYGGFDGNSFIIKNDTLHQNIGGDFIIKLDENGNKLWDKQIYNASPNTCFTTGFLNIDNNSNSIYIGGTFCGLLNISGQS